MAVIHSVQRMLQLCKQRIFTLHSDRLCDGWLRIFLVGAIASVTLGYVFKLLKFNDLTYPFISVLALSGGVVCLSRNRRRWSIVLISLSLLVLLGTTLWTHTLVSYFQLMISVILCLPLLCICVGYHRLVYWIMGVNLIAYPVIFFTSPLLMGQYSQQYLLQYWFGTIFCLMLIFPVFFVQQQQILRRQTRQNKYHAWHWRQSIKRCQELFYHSRGVAFLCDPEGAILHFNSQAKLLLKQDPAIEHHISELFQRVPRARLFAPHGLSLQSVNTDYRLKVEALEHHNALLVQCFMADSEVLSVSQGRSYAVDPVTGLSDYHQWFSQYVQFQSPQNILAVVKINNLRNLNIQKGNEVGDWLLRRIARQLQLRLGDDFCCYRFTGAKILLMGPLAENTEQQWVDQLAAILEQEPGQPLPDGDHISIHWQAGLTHMREDATGLELLEECDIALNQSFQYLPWVWYRPQYRRVALQHSQQQELIYDALNQGRLKLFLQAQTLADGRIVGYECLARLFDVNGRMMSPAEFMPSVEECQWYSILARLVLAEASQLIDQWPKTLDQDIPLSINLAGPELLDDSFYQSLIQSYQRSPLLCRRLAIELTETSVCSHHTQTQQRLNQLSQLGVSIFIDDFGTGHASLAQLVSISVEALKIDRFFVERVIDSQKHASIIRASVELARSLGLKVVAEGVETVEQLNVLRSLGCQTFQGFLFSKPTPFNQL
ncbi:EAL domain-containing protein [Celerinatantimonas sp. YJH-8]|uniref:EAL domain-containing protein n=1 Tax=Celerinatantimonas sp. YJH-8 TaxID=3228714 RepID=UPI0038C2F9E0